MSTDPVNSQSVNPTNIALLDVIKLIRNGTREEYDNRLSQFISFLNPHIRPSFVNITGSPYTNSELNAIFADFQRQIDVNTLEIAYLNRLLALLIFELIEQGIKIQHKELINEMEIYLKNGYRG